MANRPPLLPSQAFRRIERVATLNGSAVLFISGLLAIASIMARDYSGAFAGFVIAAAGAMELRGLSLAKGGNPRGSTLLVVSQIYLLAVILAYVVWKLSPEQTAEMERTLSQLFRQPELEALVSDAGLTRRELSEQIAGLYRPALVAVGLLTTVHQGAMAFFYHRRRHLVPNAGQTNPVTNP